MAIPQVLYPPVSRPPLKLIRPVTTAAAAPSPELWLALTFPTLPLEALDINSTDTKPVAVLEGDDARSGVCALTATAKARGATPGQSAQTVLAWVPDMRFVTRNPAAETRALAELAHWASGFTPTVSVQPPDALLLEMRGSLHLFGSPQKLQSRLHRELVSLGHQVQVAFAPTPRAALWCARAGREVCLDDSANLHSVLGQLPLAVLPGPREWTDAFRRLGLVKLHDLLRLPRDGLARRFGPELLRTLDRALGTAPDPVATWTAAAHYTATRDLDFEVWHTESLLPVIEELLTGLECELRCHDAGIHGFEITFSGYRHVAQSFSVGTRELTRDPSHWMRLVHTQLENMHIDQIIETVELRSGRFEPYSTRAADLFVAHTPNTVSLVQLLDTLRTRLGARGIAGLKVRASHRPEKAWCWTIPGEHGASPLDCVSRPLWLLDEPQALATAGALPVYDGGPLSFDSGPERIECGGWTDREIRRDYYHARTVRGARLWVYRELDPPQRWFLQGYFA